LTISIRINAESLVILVAKLFGHHDGPWREGQVLFGRSTGWRDAIVEKPQSVFDGKESQDTICL